MSDDRLQRFEIDGEAWITLDPRSTDAWYPGPTLEGLINMARAEGGAVHDGGDVGEISVTITESGGVELLITGRPLPPVVCPDGSVRTLEPGTSRVTLSPPSPRSAVVPSD